MTEGSVATSTSLFQDKEQVNNIISLWLQDTHPLSHTQIHTHAHTHCFPDANSTASRGSGPQRDSEAITEHTVGRASLLSLTQEQQQQHFYPKNKDIFCQSGKMKITGKVREKREGKKTVYTSIVQLVQSHKGSPLCNLVLMSQDINHCKLCLFTLIQPWCGVEQCSQHLCAHNLSNTHTHTQTHTHRNLTCVLSKLL